MNPLETPETTQASSVPSEEIIAPVELSPEPAVAAPAEPTAQPAADAASAAEAVDATPGPEQPESADASFGDVLREFEAGHAAGADAILEGTIVSVTPEAVVIDVGRKMEGIIRPDAPGLPQTLTPGATIHVSITGRTDDGYYSLSTIRVEQPKDFTALQTAYDEKHVISGTVTELVKGGLRVDVGVPAFLPASRSGIREMNEMSTLIGQTIECRITKLDVSNPDRPDVVIDRRSVIEEQANAARDEAFGAFQEGMVTQGRVRSLTDFGAFVELAPGIDGLLHVTDISWNRVDKPGSVLTVGQTVEVKILKLNRQTRKLGLGMKQLTPDPWTQAAESFKPGDRVNGKVVRLADFGAFVELLPGVDGLIHLSEMSWTKRVHKPSEVLQVGEQVDVVVLDVKHSDKRISLGLKQALGNPWDDVDKKFPVGAPVEGAVTNLAAFGAFVDLGNGIEGMIHIGDITREKRLQHPKDMLTTGQVVKAAVVEVDKGRKRIRLSMKQLEPTSADVFIGEHAVGDMLSGRVVEVHGASAKIEISEGVHARCKLKEEAPAKQQAAAAADVTDLAAMLATRWKSGPSSSSSAKEGVRPNQIRRFKITAMDTEARKIDVELAD
ncbi:MAG TPA: S1 RNA-binding domain-containing protein [Bryobacteraceae bacterium]|nr:S1 RNA-binding domain-containing protein [Bryobacteraceae bacterium]